ncbi:hypothetical protein [Pelagibacterium lacus]|uniref:Uncharacterized protein n=1 Tax=Pelagibacterium lacus TaxID=2282655 RepID=A0A369W546_9HYPH|nr:hypothetical protein [Pelagibacterium lacus]RDE08985.1 hypothetical protein DVH29_08495 [Pelagibacterium lacus]
MDFTHRQTALATRVLALASLVIGLADAAGLLGLGRGSASPIAALGRDGFVLLSALTLMRLFAAIGLWMRVQWGAVILGGSLLIEIGLYLAGSAWIALSLWGFIFKTATLLATIALLGFARFLTRRQLAD